MLDPEALARASVPGSGAVVLRLLARGPGHATYRVRRDGRCYAMRLLLPPAPGRPAAAHGQFRLALVAASAGVGPAVARCDPDAGILVTEWIRGRAWTRAFARDPASAARFAALVRRIQALEPGQPRRTQLPADWIRHYGSQQAAHGTLPSSAAAQLAGEAIRRLAAFARLSPCAALLCHSDLHRRNLLDGPGGLIAL